MGLGLGTAKKYRPIMECFLRKDTFIRQYSNKILVFSRLRVCGLTIGDQTRFLTTIEVGIHLGSCRLSHRSNLHALQMSNFLVIAVETKSKSEK